MNGDYCQYNSNKSISGIHGLACRLYSESKCFICGGRLVEYICPQTGLYGGRVKNNLFCSCDFHSACFYSRIVHDSGFRFCKNGKPKKGYHFVLVNCTFKLHSIKKTVCHKPICREVWRWWIERMTRRKGLVCTVPERLKGMALLTEFLEMEAENEAKKRREKRRSEHGKN